MAATASKRFMNWTGVTFTPTNGSPTLITGVVSIHIESGGSLARFSGDGDRYSTTVVNDFHDPTITIQTADLGSVSSFPVGTVGTFTATLNDARNGAGTGAIVYTLTNAIVASNPVQGKHRQFGLGVLTMTAYSTDGVTNPLAVSIAQ
jgi:hypothetical protein